MNTQPNGTPVSRSNQTPPMAVLLGIGEETVSSHFISQNSRKNRAFRCSHSPHGSAVVPSLDLEKPGG